MTNKILAKPVHMSTEILGFLGLKETDDKIEVLSAIHHKITHPSISGSFKKFWGLGEKWWMQMIDGRFHHLGPMVFDEGRHKDGGGIAEPNYLKGACRASFFASKLLNRLPNLEFYKNLHRIACQYFDGASTIVNSDQVGEFTGSGSCEGTYYDLVSKFSEDESWYIWRCSKLVKHTEGCPESEIIERVRSLEILNNDDGEFILNEVAKARDYIGKFSKWVVNKISAVNSEIAVQSRLLDQPQIAKLILIQPHYPWKIEVQYYLGRENVGRAVEDVMVRFAKEIVTAKNPDEELLLIAELFQLLEWIHPFPDGQGRTDLILLSKLLTEHGFNPAILKMPYYSTYHLRKEWVKYLKEGIEAWKKEAESVNR